MWEGTPRAVPPPLGAPPPVEREAVSQGSMTAVRPEPRTVWGGKPLDAANGRAGTALRGVDPSAAVASPPPVGHHAGGRLPVKAAALAGVVLVVAVAAVMATRSGGKTASAPIPLSKQPAVSTPSTSGQSPVTQALANLAAQPMLRYSGLSSDGRASWQLTVTSDGEAQGTIALGGGKLSALQVGGRTYFKAADAASAALLGELPSGITAAMARGTWVTGDSALEALLPSGLASARDLAASLRSEVPPPAQASGDPTAPVTTSAGVLYISASQPYRVLRLVPTAAAPGQPTDVETLSQTTATTIADSLIDQTKSLTGALDFGITFTYREGPKIYCSDDVCTVQLNAIVASAAYPAANPTGAVVADVIAQVSVNGQSAGQCEVVAEVPLDRSENLSCQDPDAASAVGDGDVDVAVDLRFEARANTQDDVDALVSAEQNELLLNRGGAVHAELG